MSIGAALFILLRSESPDGLDVEAWIDIGVVTLVVFLIQWQLSLSEALGDSSTPTHVRLVWALYPALDSVLVALVIRAVIAGRLRRSAATALAAGASCWFLSDLMFAITAPTLDLSAWLDVGWIMGAVLLAVVAWRVPALGPTTHDEPDLRVGFVRISLALVPLLIPGVIEVVGWAHDHDPNPVPLFLATVGLVGLALARGMRISRRTDEARTMLRSAERRARIIAENAADASLIVDPNGIVLTSASALGALLGEPRELVAALTCRRSCRRSTMRPSPDGSRECREVGHQRDRDPRPSTGRRTDVVGGRAIDRCDDPDIGGIVVNLRDVTARKLAERELQHQAFHDGLTGLANRALFTDRVQQACVVARGRSPSRP